MPPPPQPLPDEIVEEVLLRIPPENPAGLVRAGLVCRRWCRLVSDPDFRRRFREFHGRPPLLGMVGNISRKNLSTFIPTTAFRLPRTDLPGLRVLDARHGRVLFHNGHSVLAVWDPITGGELRQLLFPQKLYSYPFTAALLCSAAAGACNHLDCHRGPFLVVFVCANRYGNTAVYTYSSDAAAWSVPVGLGYGTEQKYIVDSSMASVLVGNALYFGNVEQSTALKYDLELRRLSLIRLLSVPRGSLLTAVEDGGLGLVIRDDSKLYMWSTKDAHELDAKWERRVIELKTLFPAGVNVTQLHVIGSLVGIIFMRTLDDFYTIDLKTYKVKKVYQGAGHPMVPYMSFYTPVLRVATRGEGLSAGPSTAEQT